MTTPAENAASPQEAPATELDPRETGTATPPQETPPPDARSTARETTDDPPPDEEDARVTKANREAERYRKQLRQAEARLAELEEKEKAASMSLEERVKAAEQRAKQAEADAKAQILRAERRAALASKVTNPDRVLKLMDDPDSYFDGSEPNLEQIVADFPEYAPPTPKTSAPSTPPGAGGSAPRQPPQDDASAALARGDIRAYAAAIAAQQARALAPKE
jgi:hypothetical protein